MLILLLVCFFNKKGVGTKVAKKGIVGGIKNWLSFSQMLGIEIRNFEQHISRKKLTEEIANFFNTTPYSDTERCIVLERVRGNKEYPFVYFISYFNPAIPMTGDEDFI